MYTKKELLENEKIENAIHENYKQSRKVYKQNTFLDYLLLFLGASVFLFGLMFLIAVIGYLIPVFNLLAVIITYIFPRIAIAVRPAFNKKG